MSENKYHQSNTDADISKIITSLQHGDNSGFETIFNLYYSDVYNIAMRNVNDSDAAGDITQETFIEIFETISSLREPNAFKAWVKKIAYHRCTNYFRIKDHRHEAVIDEEEYEAFVNNIEEDGAVFSPEGSLDQSALREILMNIIFSLPPEQRETVLMYYYEDMTVAEIADIQAAPADTVKSRLYYGRKALKKGIENYEMKSAIKLHGLSVIPLFRWALESESFVPSVESVASIAEGIASATGVSVTAGKGFLIQGETIMSKFITSIKAFVSANKVASIVVASAVGVAAVAGGVGVAVASANSDKDTEKAPVVTTDVVAGTGTETENGTAIDSTMIDTETGTETEKETEADTEKADDKETEKEAETVAPETDAPATDAPATQAPDTQAPETTPAPQTQAPQTETSTLPENAQPIELTPDSVAETYAPSETNQGQSAAELVPSNNLSAEEQAEQEQRISNCRYCGETRSTKHYRPFEDASCPYCGTVVAAKECHDCGK